MAIPFLIGGAALLVGAAGIGAGLSAKDKWDTAENIVDDAKDKYERALEKLEAQGEKTNGYLERLGELKVQIFENQITHIVEVLSKNGASSKISGFQNSITAEDVGLLKAQIKEVKALQESSKGLAQGTITGALAGFGAYGAVGAFGAASTGAAITGLSGAAATNATLAWLGGGALKVGGLGIAGGSAVLGGVVVAPALLVAGVYMDSKADEALTEAEDYAAEVEIAIENIKTARSAMRALRKNAKEVTDTLQKLVERFEQVKVYSTDDPDALQAMLIIGKGLKEALNTPIIDSEGNTMSGIKAKCSGYLEVMR